MNKALSISMIVIVGFTFYAAEIPGEKLRVKMMVHYFPKGNDTTEYFYNKDGHIASTQNSGITTSTYQYLPGKIIRKYYDKMKKLSCADTFILNEKGLAVSMTTNNKSPLNEKREFNAQRQLVRRWLYNDTGAIVCIYTYEYRNGNEEKSTETETGFPIFDRSWTSQYDTFYHNTTGNENLGTDFNGASSANPLIYCRSNQMMGPSASKYYYHFDSKGRVILKAGYNNLGKQIDSTAYIYYSGVKMVVDK